MKKVLTPAMITTLVLILLSSAALALLVTVLVFGFLNSAMLAKEKATESSQTTEIVGKVVSVRSSGHLKIFSGSLTVKDEEGKEQVVKVSSKILEGIRVGDRVDIKVEDGKAKSIIKLWGSG